MSAVVFPAGVTGIGARAFAGAQSLIFVNVPGSVKNIGNYAFNGTGITSATIYAGVEYGSDIYSNCKALASVTIQDGVTKIPSSAFLRCSNLTTVSIPDSVNEVGNNAFQRCVNLTTVTLSPDIKRKFVGDVFSGSSKLRLANQAALKKAGYTGGF
jgi:hypothetical protein